MTTTTTTMMMMMLMMMVMMVMMMKRTVTMQIRRMTMMMASTWPCVLSCLRTLHHNHQIQLENQSNQLTVTEQTNLAFLQTFLLLPDDLPYHITPPKKKIHHLPEQARNKDTTNNDFMLITQITRSSWLAPHRIKLLILIIVLPSAQCLFFRFGRHFSWIWNSTVRSYLASKQCTNSTSLTALLLHPIFQLDHRWNHKISWWIHQVFVEHQQQTPRRTHLGCIENPNTTGFIAWGKNVSDQHLIWQMDGLLVNLNESQARSLVFQHWNLESPYLARFNAPAPTLFCRICSKISKLQLRNSTYSNPTPTVASPKKVGDLHFLGVFSQFFPENHLKKCRGFILPASAKTWESFKLLPNKVKSQRPMICLETSKVKSKTFRSPQKKNVCFFSGRKLCFFGTPPKFNIALETWCLGDYFSFGKVAFQGLC